MARLVSLGIAWSGDHTQQRVDHAGRLIGWRLEAPHWLE
jgi:hypothetical protein